MRKRVICILLFFIVSSFLFSQEDKALLTENKETPSDSSKGVDLDSSSTDEDQEIDEKMVQILKWGLKNQIQAALVEISQQKKKQYVNDVAKLQEESADFDIQTLIFGYYIAVEDFRLVNQALDLLRYYDSEPDNYVTKVVKYLFLAWETNPTLVGDEFGELLWSLYQFGGPMLGQKALITLGELGDKTFIEKLKIEYSDYSAEETLKPEMIRVIGKLGGVGEKEWILETLKGAESKSEIWACCETIAILGDSELFETLYTKFTESKDPYLRMKIVKALDNYDDSQIEKILFEALRDEFWRVRLEAIKKCSEKKFTKFIPQLIFKVKTEPENVVKQEAIKSLGIIQNEEALKFLIENAKDKKLSLSIRKGIISAIFKYDSIQFIDDIIELVESEEKKSNSKLIPHIAVVAGKSQKSGMDKLFSHLLASDKPPIQFAAIKGLQLNSLIVDEERLNSLYSENKENYLGKAIAKLLKIDEDD